MQRSFIVMSAVTAMWLSVFLTGGALAYEKNPQAIFCPIVEKTPAIDGKIEEGEWSTAEKIPAMADGPGKAQDEDTAVWVMADSSNLYVAFRCGGPDGKPKGAQERGRDEVSTADDSVMLMVDLYHDNKTSQVFLVGYYGGKTDGANGYPDVGGIGDLSWNADWDAAVSRGEESWSVEMAIPEKVMSGAGITAGRTVGVNFARNRPGLATRSYLALGGGGLRPPWYADMIFGEPGVALSEIVMPSWRQGPNSVSLKFKNYGKATAEVEVRTSVWFRYSSSTPEAWPAKAITLAPGEEAPVELSGDAYGDVETSYLIEAYDNPPQRVLYRAWYSFDTLDAADDAGNAWRVVSSGTLCFQPEPFRVELQRTEEAVLDREFEIRLELWAYGSRADMAFRKGPFLKTPVRTRALKTAADQAGRLRIEEGTEGLSDDLYGLWVTVTSADGNRMLRTAQSFVCVGEQSKELKARLGAVSESAARFEKEGPALGLARSSVLMLRYLVEEAERDIAGASVENFTKALESCAENVARAEELATSFAKGVDPLKGKKGVVERALVSPYDGTVRTYAVFVPSSYDASKPFPLVAHLLSDGPRGILFAGMDEIWDHVLKGLEEKGFICVWPSLTRRLEAEVIFFGVLEEMKRDYNIDEERVYLTGISGGGLSSWLIGLMHPDQIAAIAPVSGVTVASEAVENPKGNENVIDKTRSAYYFPMNALHVPVIVLHGDVDTVTLVDTQARPMVAKMRELGLEAEYVEYPGAEHGLGKDYMDASDKMLDFFSRHRNVRYPKTIDFSTPSLRYNKAYWMWIEEFMKEGEFARVKAEAKDNVIKIETENVATLSLVPRPEVLDFRAPVTVILDGAQKFHGRVPLKRSHSGPWMRFTKGADGGWQ